MVGHILSTRRRVNGEPYRSTSLEISRTKRMKNFRSLENIPRGGGEQQKGLRTNKIVKKNKKNAPTQPMTTIDTDFTLALKMFAGVILETFGLLGVVALGNVLSSTFKTQQGKAPVSLLAKELGGLHWMQWISLSFIVFNSSFLSSFLTEGGKFMSVATNQILKPNTIPNDPEWYQNLQKPKWNPPGFVFPIMWLIVSKPTQLLALRQLLQTSASTTNGGGSGGYPWNILAVYCGHLALGNSWNKVFFGCQRIGLGVFVISIFFSMLCWSAYLFRTVDSTAGNLLLPTCAWVFVATSLNWSIFFLNKDKKV